MNIKKRWSELFGLSENSESIWTEIEKQYSNVKRTYHNLEHLKFMFIKLDEFFPEFKNNKSLNLAIYFHDFYYSVLSNDNELKSAKFAKKQAEILKLDPSECELVYNLILSTKNHNVVNSEEIFQILSDLDLCILATEAGEYIRYANKIREEFKYVPTLIYINKRKQFLKNLLSKEQLFFNEKLFYLEKKARFNIREEVQLGSKILSFKYKYTLPLNIENNSVVRKYPNSTFLDKEKISNIKRVISYKIDCFTYDEIIVEIIFKDRSIQLSESTVGFADFCTELGHYLEKSKPFERWYFEVMMPPFELSLTQIYERSS